MSAPPTASSKYKKTRKVGKGGYGAVFLVQNSDSKKYYVLKEVSIMFLKEAV